MKIHKGLRRSFLVFLVTVCQVPIWAEKTIEIEKGNERLLIKDGDKVIKEYSCSIGRGGDDAKSKMGDNLTPEGEYRIVRINKASGFHIFLHLSYPNRADIEKGKSSGIINDSEYQKMLEALSKGALPQQNTKLGGNVGIHGIRNGFGWLGPIHRFMNWTQGCIAVTDKEIEEISAQIGTGTRVIIKK